MDASFTLLPKLFSLRLSTCWLLLWAPQILWNLGLFEEAARGVVRPGTKGGVGTGSEKPVEHYPLLAAYAFSAPGVWDPTGMNEPFPLAEDSDSYGADESSSQVEAPSASTLPPSVSHSPRRSRGVTRDLDNIPKPLVFNLPSSVSRSPKRTTGVTRASKNVSKAPAFMFMVAVLLVVMLLHMKYNRDGVKFPEGVEPLSVIVSPTPSSEEGHTPSGLSRTKILIIGIALVLSTLFVTDILRRQDEAPGAQSLSVSQDDDTRLVRATGVMRLAALIFTLSTTAVGLVLRKKRGVELEQARKKAEEEESRKKEEERQKAEEEEERKEAEVEARRKAEEGRKKAHEEARKKAEEEAKKKAEEEKRMKAEEEERMRIEEEARREAEEEERRKAEEEARVRAEEEERMRIEEEARMKAEEEARVRAEEEERMRIEEEARRKAEEDARVRAEEEERMRIEEEARRKAEEEARVRAEEEERMRIEEEARRKAEEEEKRRKAEEEERMRVEEEKRRKAEEEARRKAEEEVRRKAEEEARMRAEEEARVRAEEEERVKAEEEERMRSEEEDRMRIEEEERKKAEKAKRQAEAKRAEEIRKAAEAAKKSEEAPKGLVLKNIPVCLEVVQTPEVQQDFGEEPEKPSPLEVVYEPGSETVQKVEEGVRRMMKDIVDISPELHDMLNEQLQALEKTSSRINFEERFRRLITVTHRAQVMVVEHNVAQIAKVLLKREFMGHHPFLIRQLESHRSFLQELIPDIDRNYESTVTIIQHKYPKGRTAKSLLTFMDAEVKVFGTFVEGLEKRVAFLASFTDFRGALLPGYHADFKRQTEEVKGEDAAAVERLRGLAKQDFPPIYVAPWLKKERGAFRPSLR